MKGSINKLLEKRIYPKTIKYKIIYKLKQKIYNLLYRQSTYIPEKGVWVLTKVFPSNIVDNICGITDVFKGNNKEVTDWIPVHSEYIYQSTRSGFVMFMEYITGLLDYRMVHNNVVKSVKEGKVTIPDFWMLNEVKI